MAKLKAPVDPDWEERKARDPSIVDDIYTAFMGAVEECDANQAAPTNQDTAARKEEIERGLIQFQLAFANALEEAISTHGIHVVRMGRRNEGLDDEHFEIHAVDREGRRYTIRILLSEANEILVNYKNGGQRLLDVAVARLFEARARRVEKEAPYAIN